MVIISIIVVTNGNTGSRVKNIRRRIRIRSIRSRTSYRRIRIVA